MKQALFLLLGLILASCATITPKFTTNPPSAGWTQVVDVAPPFGSEVQQPLYRLRHQTTGALIEVDAYKFDGQPVAEIGRLIRDKLIYAGFICTALIIDGETANFRIVFTDKHGTHWRGKIAVRRVIDAPSTSIYVFTGRWPQGAELQIVPEFDAIAASAAVK